MPLKAPSPELTPMTSVEMPRPSAVSSIFRAVSLTGLNISESSAPFIESVQRTNETAFDFSIRAFITRYSGGVKLSNESNQKMLLSNPPDSPISSARRERSSSASWNPPFSSLSEYSENIIESSDNLVESSLSSAVSEAFFMSCSLRPYLLNSLIIFMASIENAGYADAFANAVSEPCTASITLYMSIPLPALSI